MPHPFETEIDKALTACKTLAASLASLAANVKTHSQNYDNACNMYYASEDQIKEIEDKIKKDHGGTAGGGGAAVLSKLNAELKKWQGNHPKLAARVKSENTEVEKLKGGLTQAEKAEDTIRATYKKLSQGVAKSGVTDLKAAQLDIKSIDTQLIAADKEIKRLETVLENCMPYPKSMR